jgi:hypothetical protein
MIEKLRAITMNQSRYPLRERVIIAALVLPFLVWLLRYINLDFWYDEVFTLNNYVFVPLKKTVTDYSFPNNHIFFNLINNLFLKFTDTKNIYELIDHTYVIRLLPLAYSMVTLYYLYLAGKKIFNKSVAQLSLILLVTTVPYYNFALQVRGYGLSTMLICMTVYHLWSFEKKPGWADILLLIASSSLAIYTIPSNLYVMLAMALFCLLAGIFPHARKEPSNHKKNPRKKAVKISLVQQFYDYHRYFLIFFILITGILLAVFLYLPVMNQLLNNPYTESKGLFNTRVLGGIMPGVFVHFISQRYLLIPVILFGLLYCIVSLRRGRSEYLQEAFFLFVTLILPFVFSFIRGDRPFDRVFVVLTPLFVLLLALFIYFLSSAIPALRSRPMFVVAGVFLYCNLTFAFSIGHIKQHLRDDIEKGRKSQDIYYNYYQAYYHPLKVFAHFSKERRLAFPVIAYEYDVMALPTYLTKVRINAYEARALDPLLRSEKHVYVITSFPNKFESMVKQKYPQYQTRRINEQPDFHTIFLVENND